MEFIRWVFIEFADGSCYAISHIPFYLGWILGLIGIWIMVVFALFAMLSFLSVVWRGD